MTITFLRIMILVQSAIAGIAIYKGYWYLDWQDASLVEIKNSPDAARNIKNLLTSWWFFKGVSVGFAMCLAFMAIAQIRSIFEGNWNLRIHWMVLALPLTFVLWFV